ncbi:MAG TPA: DUF2092 domain-containing protein, partial [Planctomycetota bacterium]|nr:DUF2092 domain-containing protein [Planctomycetota bacterium]
LLALLTQEDAARARALLEESSGKFKAAPALAYEASTTQVSENSKEPYGQNVATMVLLRPNRLRWDLTGKNSDMLTILDGSNLWQLDRKKNEYSKYPQEGYDFLFRDGPLNALYVGDGPQKILEGARDVKIRQEKEGETPFDVITWKAKSPNDRVESADFTLWIGPDRLPRRFVKQYEWRDTIYTHTTEYAKIDLAPKITDQTFAFTPPPGSKVADPNEWRRKSIPTTEAGKKAQKLLEGVQEAFRKVEAVSYELTTESTVGPVRREFCALKRPNLMRRATGESEAEATNLILCDGSDVWFMESSERTYRKFPMLSGPTQNLGTTDPFASLFFQSGSPLVLGESTDVTLATEDLAGVRCDVIGWTLGQSSGYRQKLKLWIDADRHPRQLANEWTSQGRTGILTTKFASFNLAPIFPASHLAFKPGANWRDLTNERPGARHLAVGSPAPDFEAVDRGGAPIKLSDLRGKPVVLVFGKYAHPTELDRAQEFHDDFGARGVIVLAVSSGKKEATYDPKKHTFRLVRPRDPATAASYGADIWGSLYLIDKDGKVTLATLLNDELKAAVNKLIGLAAPPPGPAAPAGGEKEARETLKLASEALKKAESVAYPATWHLKDSAGITRFECKIQLKRPNLVRLEGAYKADYGRDDAGIFVLDGKNEWGFYPKEKDRQYTCRPQDPDPAAGFYDDPVRLFFFGEPLTRWMELTADLRQTSDRLNGTPCSVIEWRVRYTSDVRYRLWIDGSSTVRRIERTVAGELYLAADYGKIELNPKAEEGAFRFEPPAATKRSTMWEDFEKKLIAVGADTPDFEAKDLEGKSVKLSAWRGQPVLFITWSFP